MRAHASTHTGFGPSGRVAAAAARAGGIGSRRRSGTCWRSSAAAGGGGPLVQLLPGSGTGPQAGPTSQPGFPRCAGREAEHQLQYTRSSHDVRSAMPSHGFGFGAAAVHGGAVVVEHAIFDSRREFWVRAVLQEAVGRAFAVPVEIINAVARGGADARVLAGAHVRTHELAAGHARHA